MTVRAGVVSVRASRSSLSLSAKYSRSAPAATQRFDDLARVAAPLDDLQQLLMRDHLLQQPLEVGARRLQRRSIEADHARLGGALDQVTSRDRARP